MTTKSDQDQKESTKTEIAKKEATQSERFTEMVMREFKGKAGNALQISPFQRRLIQNYFIGIDMALKTAEIKRQEKSKDQMPILWQNVNMESLAISVVACSRIGFDPALPNHINMMPFKNNHTQKYDIVFIEGYRGKELKAKKYGLDIPDDVIVEVVYSTDTFKPIKKDRINPVETYEFEVTAPFDRGEIVGGFYYYVWAKTPEKNKLVFFSKAEIEKRKPRYASTEFWGGEKDIWKDGQKTGKKEKIEGWYHEMVYKTICRAAYGAITIDSKLIDEDFMNLLQNDQLASIEQTEQEISDSANKEPLEFTHAEDVTEQPEQQTEPDKQPKTPVKEEKVTEITPDKVKADPGVKQGRIGGPGF